MPKKAKKNRASGSAKSSEANDEAPEGDTVIANLAASDDIAAEDKLKHLQEMFLDRVEPDVVQMVYQESGFNVEQSLESLFELANANSHNFTKTKSTQPNQLFCDLTSQSETPSTLPSSSQNPSQSVANKPVLQSRHYADKQVIENYPDGQRFSLPSPSSYPPRQKTSALNAVMPYASLFASNKHYEFTKFVDTKPGHPSQVNLVNQTKDEIKKLIIEGKKVLVLMRGLPGSGKSTLAQSLINGCKTGVILSTDNYFYSQQQIYKFDPELLPIAHETTQRNAKKCISQGISPIIIDNTNLEAWEMRPYVCMGYEAEYQIFFLEADTQWKRNPKILAMKNQHGVSKEKIALMALKFEDVTVDYILKTSNCLKMPAKTVQNQNCITKTECSSVLKKENIVRTISSSSESADKNLPPSAPNKLLTEEVPTLTFQRENSDSPLNDEANSPTRIDLGFLLALSQRNADSDTSSIHTSEVGSQESGWEKDDEFTWKGSSAIIKSSAQSSEETKTKTSQTKNTEDLKFDEEPKDQRQRIRRIKDGSPVEESHTKKETDDLDFKEPWESEIESSNNNNLQSNSRRVFGLIGIKRSNWEIPPFPGEKSEDNNNLENEQLIECFSQDTQTESKDWAFLELGQCGNCDCFEASESKFRFKMKDLSDKNRKAINFRNNKTENKVNLDKSTSTSDLPDSLTVQEKLDVLKNSFPQAEESHLKEILDACHGDLNWANKLLSEFDDDHFEVGNLDILATNSGENEENCEETIETVKKEADVETQTQFAQSNLVSLATQTTDSQLVLRMDANLASQLEKLFGPISDDDGQNSGDGLLVNLSHGAARLLHHHWKKTYQQKLAQNQITGKQNMKVNGNQKKNLENLKKERSLKETVPKGEFQEIMDLELALDQSKREYENLVGKDLMSTKLKGEQLYMRYPTIDKKFLNEVFESNNFSLGNTIKVLDESLGHFAAFNDETQALLNEEDTDSQPTRSRSNSPLKVLKEQTPRNNKDVKLLLAEMSSLFTKKKEFQDKAHHAYQRKMYAVASYYGEEAGLINAEINKLSKEVVDTFLNASINKNELDLHGLHVAQVNYIISEYLNKKYEELRRSPGRKKLQVDIITGYGATKGVQGRIQPVVIQYLRQRGIKYEMKNPGVLRVTLTQQ